MSKIALITGASSGIGAACALRFAEGGYDLVLTGRNAQKLQAVADEAQALGRLTEAWQEIDVLINNAGLALGLEPEFQGDFEDWDTMIDTNIKGLLNMTRLIVPGMVERGRGQIINIGSVAGDAAYANGAVYCATKSAVKTLTDGLRIDLMHTPIRVTNIKPGLVETNFSKVRFHGDVERASHVYEGIEPLTGADVADVAYYAASAPAHVQIAEVLVLATHQASGSNLYREK